LTARVQDKLVYYEGRGMSRGAANHYLGHLGVTDGRILDLGCGRGEFGAHAPPGMSVAGVDIDPGAVAIAAQYEDSGVVDLEAEPLPYPDSSFDGVLAKDILEHMQAPWETVRELYRVMKPGAVVVASVIMWRSRRVWSDYTHVRGFTRRSAQLLFADAGFQVERIWKMGGVPLTNRLGLIHRVPTILRFPPADWAWASSWELRARK
jgi:SAM-dependent methyltransferase